MKRTSALLLVLFLAFVLRLVHLDQSLWLDEAISALAARDFTFWGIINDFLSSDNHPPLFYLTLRAWGLLVGFSDVSLRLLSVIFGILTVLMTYFIGKKISNSHKFALTSAVLLATSPLHVYYSQELRMYPMIALEAALLFYFFLFLFDDFVKKRYWILFSVLLVLFVATDYITVFLLPVFAIYAIFQKKPVTWWLLFIATGFPLLIFGFFWLPYFINQTRVGKNLLEVLPQWATLSGGANFKEAGLIWMKFILGRISLNDKSTYYGLVAVCSVPFLFLFFKSALHFKRYQTLWLWLIAPLAAGFVFSFIIPAFTYFRFIYLLPAFYMLLSAGLRTIHNSHLRKIVASTILFINLLGVSLYYTDPMQHRENWKEAVQYMEISGEAEDLAVFEFTEPFAPFRWYSRGEVEGWGGLDSLSANKQPTFNKMQSRMDVLTGDVYHFSYLRDLTDRDGFIEKSLSDSGFIKTGSKSFHGVGEISKYEKVIKTSPVEQ